MLFRRTKKVALAVGGMSCGHCEQTVEKGLASIDGIARAKASHEESLVTVHFKGDTPPDLAAVRAKVSELGYEPADAWR